MRSQKDSRSRLRAKNPPSRVRAKGTSPAPRPLAAIILAAGRGTRMNSDLPKVVHPVGGKPMVRWVVEAVRRAGADRIILVVGHGAELVERIFADDADDLEFVVQHEQRGTGHATLCAREALAGFDGDVLVLAGDGPLIRPQTIRSMVALQRRSGAAATIATAVLDDPSGYGRVVRDEDDGFEAIVEERNATADQRTIREVYPSYSCFDRELLFQALEALEPDDLSGELYVTAVPALLRESGHDVEIEAAVPAEDVLSINTPEQLEQVAAILIARQEQES